MPYYELEAKENQIHKTVDSTKEHVPEQERRASKCTKLRLVAHNAERDKAICRKTFLKRNGHHKCLKRLPIIY